MKKILYILSTLKRTGPTNQLFNLIKYLDRKEFNPRILTLSPEPSDSRKDDFVKLGCSVDTFGLSRAHGFLLGQRRLRRYVDELSPDLIHTQGFRADSFSAKLKVSIPRMCTVRNLPQLDYPAKFGHTRGILMAHIHGRVFAKLDLCIGVSESVSENLRNRFGVFHAETVRNGVDEDLFRPASTTFRSKLRTRRSIKTDDVIVVSVGALDAGKDPMTVVRGLQAARNTWHQAVFLGDGPLLSQCTAATQTDPGFNFPGNVPDVIEYLQGVDAFVSASHAEGLPNSVLEAMACGIPTILSDIPPHRELIPPELHSKLLFQVGNSTQLSDRLKQITSEKSLEIGAQLHKHFQNHFTALGMSENYQEIYGRLLSEHSRSK